MKRRILKWVTVNENTPYIGYATDQTDGTFVIGSNKGTNYASGLAIGGGSGNLLWKGNKVAVTSDIPTVNNATLTIQKNGTSVGTFTANASSNSTVNITVPTGAAADKGVVTTIDTSANLPTSNAVKTFVEGKGYITSSGSITGNAATATKATQDGSGNVITSTYAKKTDLNSYLPLSGGTINGNLFAEMVSGETLITTAATQVNSAPSKIAVIDSNGVISYRSLSNFISDLNFPTNYVTTNTDQTIPSNKTFGEATTTTFNGASIFNGGAYFYCPVIVPDVEV